MKITGTKKNLSIVLMALMLAAVCGAQASAEVIYGTVNLPYADFYYGEINNVEADLTATAGDYTAENKVTAAGFDAEGMYDAVTSATTNKSQRFGATYTETVDTGVNILGIKDANVAISKELYDDVQAAIAAGTECSNGLIDIVKGMTVTEGVPAEYKVINPDGTLSQTIGKTVVADTATVSFTTNSNWGNYQFSFDGIELDANTVIGGIIETEDGAKYGLEHEDNLWLRPGEVSFCVVPFTEPHGNEVAYNRFADMQGKTIVKFTYMIANGADIEIPVNAFVNYQLGEEYTATADSETVYNAEGTVINYTLTVPEDSAYALTSISFGRSSMPVNDIAITDSTITLPAGFGPGSYTFVFEDAKYSCCSFSVTINSGLADGDVVFENGAVAIAKDTELTPAQFLASINSVMVNGDPVKGKSLNTLLFDEEGNLLTDAAIDDNGSSVPVFADGENQVEITSVGFPVLTFRFTK